MLRRCLGLLILSLTGALLAVDTPVQAEPPPQSIHWGAIAFPDHDRTLTLGIPVMDRFTEFDGARRRYNDIRETMGFNFFTLSWTEPLASLPGWNLNLTAGGGPTRDGPSRFLQNDVIHKLRNFDPVPVGNKRDADDFMLSGSLTRWFGLLGTKDVFFAGIGTAGGSLYYEPYAQAGFRRLSLLDPLPLLGDYLRFSAMARYGRPYSGAAFHQAAPQSYLGQASVGLGNYRNWEDCTPWEIELAVTFDSGLFVDHRGIRWKNDSCRWRSAIRPSVLKRGTTSSIRKTMARPSAPG
ncbi:MAG: hypothetical protein U0231_08525 [Nitrospiraceae bacterium]